MLHGHYIRSQHQIFHFFIPSGFPTITAELCLQGIKFQPQIYKIGIEMAMHRHKATLFYK